jgi:para-aminobenzoate synthetase/4-amino-4-deoxychorismate lyase
MNRWHPLPAELYALVEHTPATVLLESARPVVAASCATDPGEAASYSESPSRLFTAPLRILIANELTDLPALFAEIESAVVLGHFAAGYFSYECGQFFEPTADLRPSRTGQPLAWLGIYDQCQLFDHHTGAFVDGNPPGHEKFRFAVVEEGPEAAPQLNATLPITEQQYAERIAAIHDWIRSGDIYQLNFTVPMRVHCAGSAAALYQSLRARQPAPFGAFLHTLQDRRILSFSPELFFRIENQGAARRITTRPMKGTAPRGRTTGEDRDIANWLSNDPKNRSENVMIVDLLRNDLGRLCAYGSVRTENLFAVERYPTLTQMTSTVTGELRSDVNFQQIFRALFPCGSVTGAPKIRAMQLLAALEREPRGVYTGAIGFFSKEETVFNVAIRTLELDGDNGSFGVGSGIVIDSNPAAEFRECHLKAKFLTRSFEQSTDMFSLIETMLWTGAYALIELHLDRLEDSACYFDFAFERAEIMTALLARAANFADSNARKIRLLLQCDGSLHIEDELMRGPANSLIPKPARVCIASPRTDPDDPMYFHKTTHRPVYAEAFKAASALGFDDVLFMNQRGEITEGAINNIFVEKDGCLSTPPVECGLLPGVYRRHLLLTRPNAVERVLSLDDLRHADAVYLSNAVRGLRRVAITWENQQGGARAPYPLHTRS